MNLRKLSNLFKLKKKNYRSDIGNANGYSVDVEILDYTRIDDSSIILPVSVLYDLSNITIKVSITVQDSNKSLKVLPGELSSFSNLASISDIKALIFGKIENGEISIYVSGSIWEYTNMIYDDNLDEIREKCRSILNRVVYLFIDDLQLPEKTILVARLTEIPRYEDIDAFAYDEEDFIGFKQRKLRKNILDIINYDYTEKYPNCPLTEILGYTSVIPDELDSHYYKNYEYRASLKINYVWLSLVTEYADEANDILSSLGTKSCIIQHTDNAYLSIVKIPIYSLNKILTTTFVKRLTLGRKSMYNSTSANFEDLESLEKFKANIYMIISSNREYFKDLEEILDVDIDDVDEDSFLNATYTSVDRTEYANENVDEIL